MGVKKTIHHYHQKSCRIFRSCENITEITKEDYKKKKKARKKYQSLSKEEKEKKQQYERERYTILPEIKKQRLVEYRKIYYKTKNASL